MPAPAVVVELVERFTNNHADYHAQTYKEDQLRQEFLNPFFEALGWDMANAAGYAEAYKDVIHEDAIKIGGQTKAPDYSFRVGGARKFFLEAKKPAVGIPSSGESAYQLRRYAWTAGLPVSVLTNFEHLAVYDCRKKPAPTDKAAIGRVHLYRHAEYVEKWDDIAAVFSKTAVLKGSFDKYAESTRGKRGTTTVDADFLEEIEDWRLQLAKSIAARNLTLTQREINYTVQLTIDRIIFLRICEDRGNESYNQLGIAATGTGVYESLLGLFRAADAKYNSGLFHFEKEKDREHHDVLTPDLVIDDKVLKGIIGKLYYPECPYAFSVMPADILGRVYEQFLGKVIRLTDGHQAKVEDKPEVKKAGGVFYTPDYVVKYIVEKTVGKLLRVDDPAGPVAPAQASKLRVLDPACGSGSFLLGAYDYLLNWHLSQYEAAGPAKHKKELVERPGGGYRLTLAEKRRILVNNIYGVDIDPQAVEVTKLSLLLKVLEGEAQVSLLAKERALPDLDRNIRCGNSMVGPDFYDGPNAALMQDTEEQLRINAFDWAKAFPATLKAGGFDAVIGNPPWGQKGIDDDPAARDYLRTRFPSVQGIFDLFRPFVECGLWLTRPNGSFGMVLPDIVLLKDYPDTRRLILDQLTISRIDWWGMAFPNAVIDAATVIGEKSNATRGHRVHVTIRGDDATVEHDLPQADFEANPRFVFNLHLTPDVRVVVDRLQAYPTLDQFWEVHEGVHSGNIREELFVPERVDDSCRELYFGRGELRPYRLAWAGQFIRLAACPKTKTKSRYANVGRSEWYDVDKVLVRRTGDYVLSAVDRHRRYASNNYFLVIPRAAHALTLDGLTALLNSTLMTWYFRAIEPRRGRAFAELKIKHLVTFPVPSDAVACNRLNALGAERARLADDAGGTALPHAQDVIRRRVDHVDAAINHLVCDTFGVDEALVGPTTLTLEAS